MAYTNILEDDVSRVRGLLTAMGLQNHIRIAFDEWNLRGWYHPNSHTIKLGQTPEEYLKPRDLNDENCRYTMADAVFTACFLNMCNRNCDIVGMANFAPVVNTRGCVYTHRDGIVLRSTYHVFDMYMNELGDTVFDAFTESMPEIQVKDKAGNTAVTNALDLVATADSAGNIIIAAINKDPQSAQKLQLELTGQPLPSQYTIHTLSGESTGSYNDIDHDGAVPEAPRTTTYNTGEGILLPPHSVNIVKFIGVGLALWGAHLLAGVGLEPTTSGLCSWPTLSEWYYFKVCFFIRQSLF
jgi:alpha-N-arabinofuranosidase